MEAPFRFACSFHSVDIANNFDTHAALIRLHYYYLLYLDLNTPIFDLNRLLALTNRVSTVTPPHPSGF
jgi:hypothetical protein